METNWGHVTKGHVENKTSRVMHCTNTGSTKLWQSTHTFFQITEIQLWVKLQTAKIENWKVNVRHKNCAPNYMLKVVYRICNLKTKCTLSPMAKTIELKYIKMRAPNLLVILHKRKPEHCYIIDVRTTNLNKAYPQERTM